MEKAILSIVEEVPGWMTVEARMSINEVHGTIWVKRGI